MITTPANPSSVEDIFPKVRKCILSSTGLKESQVELDKRLVKDLDVDSIDLVDMIFSIEREFDIELSITDLESRARKLAGPDAFEVDQKITPAGMGALKKLMPEVPPEFFKENMLLPEIPLLFTVHTLCSMVRTKLSEKANG